MPIQPRGQFSLLDLIALIAASGIAVWVSMARLIPTYQVMMGIKSATWQANRVWLTWHWGLQILRQAQPALAVFTLTVLALGLIRPSVRQQLRALQPGPVACLAASLALIISGGLSLASPPDRMVASALGYVLLALMPQGSEPGTAVAAAWLILGIGGHWQAKTGWFDWVGRSLGLAWVAMIPIARLAWALF